MTAKLDAALLVVGHGSTVNPHSSVPTLDCVEAIRRRGIFRDVAACFWKEEPSMRDAFFFFRDETIREVFVVPNFISHGYFTETVIPRELELIGLTTERNHGQVWNYCQPVGANSRVTELLLKRAHEVAPEVSKKETTLLVVGHGTSLNDNSATAAKREAEKIRARNEYAAVLNVYMEEPPLISEWPKFVKTPNAVVVPFFIADGLHSFEDIPVLLGLKASSLGENSQQVFRRNPHRLHGRSLYYSRSLGTEPQFADLIIEQVETFENANEALRLICKADVT